MSTTETLRGHANEIFKAAVQAVDAEQCVRSFVSRSGQMLTINERDYNLSNFDTVYVVGAGKASPRMARHLVLSLIHI